MGQHLGQFHIVHVHNLAAQIGTVALWHPQHGQQRRRHIVNLIRRSVGDLVFGAAGVFRARPHHECSAGLEVQPSVVGQPDHQRHILRHLEIVMLGTAARPCVDDQARTRHFWHHFQQLGKAGHAAISGVNVNDKDATQGDAIASLELAHLLHRVQLLFRPVGRVLPI